MNQPELEEFHGQGGSYIVGTDGVRRRVEEPTKDHPEGNLGPRDKDGKLMVFPEKERTKHRKPAPAAETPVTHAADKPKGGAK